METAASLDKSHYLAVPPRSSWRWPMRSIGSVRGRTSAIGPCSNPLSTPAGDA